MPEVRGALPGAEEGQGHDLQVRLPSVQQVPVRPGGSTVPGRHRDGPVASNEAEYGAQLILDALAVKESWQALKTTAKAFYDQEGLGRGQFKKDTYNIYQRSSFKLIEVTFDKDKDYGKAADSFVAFYEEFPKADTAAQALNNAAAYYFQSGPVEDAVKVRHILVEDPKFGDKTKYYYDQVGYLGYDYERIADYDKRGLLLREALDAVPRVVQEGRVQGQGRRDVGPRGRRHLLRRRVP